MLPESRARAILEKFAEEASPDSRYDTATGVGRIRTARRFGLGGTPQERAQIAKMPEGALWDKIRETQSNLPPAERLRRGTATTAFVPRSGRWDDFERRELGMQPIGYSDTIARREEGRGPARDAKRSMIVAAQTGTAEVNNWNNTGLYRKDVRPTVTGGRPVSLVTGKEPARGNMADSDFQKNLSIARSLRGADGKKLQGKDLVKAFQDRMKAREQTAQSPKPEYRSPSGVAIENPFGGAAAAAPSQPKTPPAVGHVMPPAPTDAKRTAGAAQLQMAQMRPAAQSVASSGAAAFPAQKAALQAQAPTPVVAANPVARTQLRPVAAPVASPPARPAGAGQLAQQPLVPPLTLSGRFGG